MNYTPSTTESARPRWILPVIIFSQFAGTSLWFASNAVLPDMRNITGFGPGSIGMTTSAVQFGFILGTLLFALFALADRFSPRKIFVISSVLGASFNFMITLPGMSLPWLLVLRFCTGLCLTGIYPVGMKIASGWYREGLGHALGFLVGALVIGTGFPHLLRSLEMQIAWQHVILSVSVIAAAGGVLMFLLVPDGPHLVQGTPFSIRALPTIFHSPKLRAAAFGYFGHMWELYTFYAFVPLMIATHAAKATGSAELNTSLWTSHWAFLIIAVGSIGCIGGGLISRTVGSGRVAWVYLLLSGTICILSPLLFAAPQAIFLSVMVLWGIVVVGDSPQFSTLIARNAPKELVGSALTICNSIGFAITIVSIQTLTWLSHFVQMEYLFVFLTVGPLVGIISSIPMIKKSQ